ncbi:MAG: glucose-6-phosphate dehydrogenase [Verrucomicrobiota bacterium]
MESLEQLDEILSCRLDVGRRTVKPCTVVIFGASGDLTARKLIPALFHLCAEKQLPDPFRIVGFARRLKTSDAWRAELREAFQKFSRPNEFDAAQWDAFAPRLTYCPGEFSDAAAYQNLRAQLDGLGDELLRRNLVFYLATSPSQFAEVAEHLHEAGLLGREDGWRDGPRLVVEKPFGHDLASAQELNRELTRFACEKQIYRIDHYLGKETVQNILMFRFSNSVFEQLWSRQSVEQVQITVSEKLGVGGRGEYYEEAGALRDMVQNHLLQVLALVAMEPPVSLEAEAVRDEKVKLLKSIRPFETGQMAASVVRGQYTAGEIDGAKVPGYRQELNVKPDSNTDTYVALRVLVDNWRWSGVPFYLRTGKRLPASSSEVRIQFRPTPHVLFAAQCGENLDANSLTLRLQPNEGINLRFNGKAPGINMEIRPVRMQFDYHAEFGAYTPEAYQRLLLEVIANDSTLFIRRDEVETAWGIVDPIRQAWAGLPLAKTAFYPAGRWGPAAADELLARRNHKWRMTSDIAPKPEKP